MSSEDSNLQVQSLTKKHLHIYQLHLTETENLASDFYLFGVEKSVVHMLGLRQYLDIGEETPRLTRCYVDGHFWMLWDWVMSKINVVALEDWDF